MKNMLRTRVKMCGTTSDKDANKAVLCGVDALGFIFYEKSSRDVSPDTARDIIVDLPPLLDLVGVFVNRQITEVIEIVKYAGLNHVQLHGEESPDYCRKLSSELPSCNIMKAFRVGSTTTREEFSPYNDVVKGFLLDTYVKNELGGTGRVFDWNIVSGLKLQRPVILAGGLNPDNVAAAITTLRPYGIDINSGVETQPGKKDHSRLELLMDRVRRADLDCS